MLRAVFIRHASVRVNRGIMYWVSFIGSSQNSSAFHVNAAGHFGGKFNNFLRFFEYADESLDASKYFPIFFALRSFAKSANDRIETGTIAAAGEEKGFFHCCWFNFLSVAFKFQAAKGNYLFSIVL